MARYLVEVADANADEVAAVCEDAVASPNLYLSQWQAMWLFEPLRKLPMLSDPLRTWVESHLPETCGDLVRARAALVLGEKGTVAAPVLEHVYGTVGSAARPDVVWAIAVALPATDRLVRAVERETPFNKWLVEAAQA